MILFYWFWFLSLIGQRNTVYDNDTEDSNIGSEVALKSNSSSDKFEKS